MTDTLAITHGSPSSPRPSPLPAPRSPLCAFAFSSLLFSHSPFPAHSPLSPSAALPFCSACNSGLPRGNVARARRHGGPHASPLQPGGRPGKAASALAHVTPCTPPSLSISSKCLECPLGGTPFHNRRELAWAQTL